MVHPDIQHAILQSLDRLPSDMQRRVLDFAQALVTSTPKGIPGRELLCFSGVLSEADADAMERAIEKACEQVDLRDW